MTTTYTVRLGPALVYEGPSKAEARKRVALLRASGARPLVTRDRRYKTGDTA